MDDKLEEIDYKFETAGLANPECFVLKYATFNTYMVLIFTDLKKLKFIKCPIEIAHIVKLR